MSIVGTKPGTFKSSAAMLILATVYTLSNMRETMDNVQHNIVIEFILESGCWRGLTMQQDSAFIVMEALSLLV
jgi:hypothetical protein